MSKQTSLLTFEGKMGNLSFFKSKGEYRARIRGGMSKERIMKDPDMSRVRENMSEFTATAMMGKSFRRAIAKAKNFTDGTITQRLAKVFTVIKKRSLGTRGKRPIHLSLHRSLLTGFELSTTQNLMDVFTAPFVAGHDDPAMLIQVEVNLTNIREMVVAPPSATHFRLVQLAGIVSDTVFNTNSNAYVVSNETLNGLSEITLSDYYPVTQATPVLVSLSTSFNGDRTPDVTILQGLGIIFYENIGTEFYALSQGKAMRIIDAF
jgi:hypothetical protein